MRSPKSKLQAETSGTGEGVYTTPKALLFMISVAWYILDVYKGLIYLTNPQHHKPALGFG